MNQVSVIAQGDTMPIPAAQSETAAVLSMIERAARDPSVDMDKMLKLMDMRERAEIKQSRKEFDEAVAAAKAQIPPITRNATGHNSKKYADFAAIAKVVDPIIGLYGLSYRFRTAQTDRISVTCILSHKAGHSEETTLSGPADSSGNKNAIQAIGSTLTYLQRYSLVQMLGLAAAADDDGKAGTNGETITQKQADNLSDLIEAHGKNRAQFLKWAKVERFEDIPAAAYDACVKAIEHKAAAK
jgi:hypothetical protein